MERDRGGAFESAPSTLSTLPFHWGWAVLVMGALVTFGSLGLGRFGYTMVLPSMQKGLELDNAQAGALATTGLVGYMVLAVGGGLLASRYGPRIVISVGLLATGAGMLLTAAAGGFLSAAVFQLVTGMGTGASNVPVMGLLAAWFSARRRGLASGIAVSGISVGLIVVGALAPRIVAAYDPDGWRAAWLVLGAMSTALAVLSFLLLRNRPADIGLEPLGSVKRLEPVGSVKPGMPDPGGEASAQVRTRGAASAVAKPGGRLAWGAVYRAPAVWHLGLVYVAFGFSYVIYTTFFTKHLISEGGYTQAQAGTLFMVMGWASLACGVIWGSISDRIGRKRALAAVYALHAVSFALFGLWIAPLGFTISAVLFGLTAWSIPAIMAATCGDVLGPRLAPAALGFITLFFAVGQTVGPSLAGAIADAAGSFNPAFLLAAAAAALGAAGSLMIPAASTAGRH